MFLWAELDAASDSGDLLRLKLTFLLSYKLKAKLVLFQSVAATFSPPHLFPSFLLPSSVSLSKFLGIYLTNTIVQVCVLYLPENFIFSDTTTFEQKHLYFPVVLLRLSRIIDQLYFGSSWHFNDGTLAL